MAFFAFLGEEDVTTSDGSKSQHDRDRGPVWAQEPETPEVEHEREPGGPDEDQSMEEPGYGHGV
jgi:hypothetical protein